MGAAHTPDRTHASSFQKACGITNHVWTVEEMLSKMEMDYAIAA